MEPLAPITDEQDALADLKELADTPFCKHHSRAFRRVVGQCEKKLADAGQDPGDIELAMCQIEDACALLADANMRYTDLTARLVAHANC